jgi:hypothetical protein
VISGHQELAELGLLAWLFDTLEQAERAALTNLDELGPEAVADPAVFLHLLQHRPAAEVLRCAALLERGPFTMLPRPASDQRQTLAALTEVAGVAPELERCSVHLLLPLWRRGRIRDTQIWVGLPGVKGGPDNHHLAWQAAHEATVREVSVLALQVIERSEARAVEQAAVVLLAERAQNRALSEPHARWLAHFGGNAPPLGRSSLTRDWNRVLERCRSAE